MADETTVETQKTEPAAELREVLAEASGQARKIELRSYPYEALKTCELEQLGCEVLERAGPLIDEFRLVRGAAGLCEALERNLRFGQIPRASQLLDMWENHRTTKMKNVHQGTGNIIVNNGGTVNAPVGSPTPGVAGNDETPTANQEGNQSAGSSSTAEAPNLTWQEAHKKLHKMREDGEEFSTRRDIATKLGCSPATVQKALERDAVLKKWAADKHENKRAREHQWREDGREQYAASEAKDPAEIVLESEDEELNTAWKALLAESDPDERSRLTAMPFAERRNMLEVILQDPGCRFRLTGKASE